MAKLTIKQEDFCLACLETGNASEAYRRSYSTTRMKPETINRAAKELLDNPKIAARLAELRKSVEKRAQMTVESHLERLRVLSEAAEEKGWFAPAIAAEVNRGRVMGYYVDRKEIRTGPLDEVSDDQLEDHIAELKREAAKLEGKPTSSVH